MSRTWHAAPTKPNQTKVDNFKVRLTNMIRTTDEGHNCCCVRGAGPTAQILRPKNTVTRNDPTSKILLNHYAQHYKREGVDALPNLILNIVILRNTMSKEIVNMCGAGQLPWITLDGDCVSAASKEAIDNVFLALAGKVFFTNVDPMKNRSKAPRRGYGEFVSELVSFAKRVRELAKLWQEGESAVVNIAKAIRQISGFAS